VTRVAVVDHGAGNLVSIAQALDAVGAEVTVATEPSGLAGAGGVVLPGVGATAPAWSRLEDAGFVEPLRSLDVPFLGICVGMQLLFDGSDEDGAPGLGLIPGRVRRIADAPRLPHIGWNDVTLHRPDPLFAGIESGTTFYFVHSYVPQPTDPSAVVADTSYGSRFAAAVRRGDVAGVQFHPERSGRSGLGVLANFVAVVGGEERRTDAA
jgi:imidazole glycerol phosphate synthase glutamine amidotransferase subunit